MIRVLKKLRFCIMQKTYKKSCIFFIKYYSILFENGFYPCWNSLHCSTIIWNVCNKIIECFSLLRCSTIRFAFVKVVGDVRTVECIQMCIMIQSGMVDLLIRWLPDWGERKLSLFCFRPPTSNPHQPHALSLVITSKFCCNLNQRFDALLSAHNLGRSHLHNQLRQKPLTHQWIG